MVTELALWPAKLTVQCCQLRLLFQYVGAIDRHVSAVTSSRPLLASRRTCSDNLAAPCFYVMTCIEEELDLQRRAKIPPVVGRGSAHSANCRCCFAEPRDLHTARPLVA